ncbi:hypothetical protein GCM10010451_55690 [Streptomyces virens]|uniref:Uncharacterized protein n=1 Tax=Streptomyces virens TaxID=285572 RepID=A0ABP6Q009_9ACTN|nr:hypothetical protein GCM10010247_16860 [Streptomyces calvus]
MVAANRTRREDAGRKVIRSQGTETVIPTTRTRTYAPARRPARARSAYARTGAYGELTRAGSP